jgi:hypothetical protein
MSNMSYCRFENTLQDLRDCYESWDEKLTSETEIKAKARLLKLCQDIVGDYGNDE